MALSYYDTQVHQGIIHYAQQAGWILETSMVHYGVPPAWWSGDGIITIFLPHREEITRYVMAQNCPVVALYADVPQVKVARVLLDNYRVGVLAAEHFLARRFKNFAFAKFTNYDAVAERERGFKDRLAEEELSYTTLDFANNRHARSTMPASGGDSARREDEFLARLNKMLARLPRPLGLFAQSDHRANLLISSLISLGINIPSEISVLGVDNNPQINRFAALPISSIDCAREQMAFQAASLLDSLMKGEPAPEEPLVVEPIGTIARESSDHYAAANEGVVRAMRFIEHNFRDPIGVRDVVRAARLGRSALYVEFEKLFHRPISEEISFRRVVFAGDLLREGSESIATIASQAGFKNTETFCRVFKRMLKMTPKEYRTLHENTLLIKKRPTKRRGQRFPR
ncbi:MAG: substrate-binding domain-containing protein [Planctomycetia bacterium]|nr:substrate-binding domain-containing protein [Planctomycetia bacterium]